MDWKEYQELAKSGDYAALKSAVGGEPGNGFCKAVLGVTVPSLEELAAELKASNQTTKTPISRERMKELIKVTCRNLDCTMTADAMERCLDYFADADYSTESGARMAITQYLGRAGTRAASTSCFRVVDLADVDPDLVREARKVADDVIRDRGLVFKKNLTLSFVLPESSKGVKLLEKSWQVSPTVRGFFDPREPENVYIRADLSLDQLRRTVAHEFYHAWDHCRWGPIADGDQKREAEAADYGNRYAEARAWGHPWGRNN